MALFCRHNRFLADCPICSKGTAMEQGGATSTRRRAPAARAGRAKAAAAPAVKGPYGSAGPYSDDEGGYEVRLERVPGGLRLAAWAAGALRRSAPVLAEEDLPELVRDAAEQGALSEEEGMRWESSPVGDGRSAGRSGDMRDELRVERLEGGRLRIARWVMRPGRGWELQDAPVMLPAARYAEALASGAAAGSRPI
jgi:hypothetical protein